MSVPPILDSLAESVVVAAQRASDGVRLVGGAGLALLLRHRISNDLDLFEARGARLEPVVAAVVEAATKVGAEVTRVRTTPTYVRLQIVVGERVLPVDIANDGSERLDDAQRVGRVRVESLRDQRANKLVSVLSRSELRDLIDLFFIEQAGLPTLEGLDDALSKDGGMDVAWLAWAIDQLDIRELPGIIVELDSAELRAFRDGLCEQLLDRAGAADNRPL